MIEIENLTKKFGKTVSLNNVTLSLKSGDSIALMGANGAGKTTLTRLIMGYYHPDAGGVKIEGFDPIKHRTQILRSVSFVPQLPPPIKLSLRELITYICKSSGVQESEIYRYAEEMKLDLGANLNKSFFKLSGGMKQKFLIAVSLAKKSKIMIYDEPTANLDPKARDDFYRLLKEREEETLSLFVTHRIDEVSGIINRSIYMDLGEVVSDEIL